MAAVLLARLFDETAAFLPAATLESFRADLGLTYAQAGTVLALVAPGAIAGTAFTVAADRFSRRAIAAGGAFAFAACLAAFAAGASFATLAAAAVVMGIASTAMVDATEIALVDLAGDRLRPFLARSNLLGTLGDILGPVVVAGVAIRGLSWRAAFWVGAGLMAAYAVVLAMAPLPPPGAPDGDDATRPSSLRTVSAVLGDRRVWVLGLIALLLVPFDEPLLGFTIALLERERGAGAGVATLVALIAVSGGVLAFTVLARRFATVDEGRLLTGAGLAATAAVAGIALAPTVVLVAAAAFVAMVALSVGWLALQHRMLTLRPGQVGTTKAVVSSIELVGFALPAAIGALADRTSLSVAVGGYAVLGLALTGLAALAARERRPLGLACTAVGQPVDGASIEAALVAAPEDRGQALSQAADELEREAVHHEWTRLRRFEAEHPGPG